jgi:hypothetical protein
MNQLQQKNFVNIFLKLRGEDKDQNIFVFSVSEKREHLDVKIIVNE